jgi:hypothetical protein
LALALSMLRMAFMSPKATGCLMAMMAMMAWVSSACVEP